jgi:small ligand-binding sensory domain FIST
MTQLVAGVGLSTARDAADAAREAAAGAMAGLGSGRPSGALVLATPDLAAAAPALLESVAAVLGTDTVAGASVHGVIGAGREEPSGVVVTAFGGVEVATLLVPELRGRESELAAELLARLGGPATANDLVVLLPDPAAFDATALLADVDARLGPAAIVGAGAARAAGAPSLQWAGHEVAGGGAAALALRLPTPPRVSVTQSCRPVAGPFVVTRAEGHWVLELDGRPALDVYREAALGPLAADLRRAGQFVLVALPRDPAAPLRPGGYLARHVVGFSEPRRGFALPELATKGQPLAFALRDAASARDDLRAMLEGVAPARAALYFDCCARGEALFGVAGIEAAYLARALGDAPVAGLLGSCEIGPIGPRTELLTYTGVLALLG